MYGGLFGDLPSAKKSKQKESSPSVAAAGDGLFGSLPAASNSKRKPECDGSSASVQQNKSPKILEKKEPSIVSRLGTTGTAMAFIPRTAVRPRNQQQQKRAPAAPLPSPFVPAALSASSTTNSAMTPAAKMSSEWKVVKVENQNQSQTGKVDVHSENQQHANREEEEEEDEEEEEEDDEEEENRRRMHAKLTLEDPYDPLVPNDLLQYWERRALAKKREYLERERRETLEEQNRIRKVLAEERQELERKGDVDKLVEHRMQHGMGRGRGRGVSNLPAWLVEKQRKQRKAGD